ncbi:hypothetical protein [Marinifilum caeruleilacunae]|uniref:Uncharacterized protein n=1 Tax=Marinifilum caeruleilacunae TaxID=2499076 RepID=A0ABX1WU52_9BACT|nr:hypothetical protein [Marinifilum caeruleilacunae]NOU59638.1 hypothetical protein [Marinifilum caeruleilacunae]
MQDYNTIKLRIYNKLDWSDRYHSIFWIGTALFLISLIVITSIYTNEEISANPILKGYFWLSIPIVLILGIYELIGKYESLIKKHEPIKPLKLTNNTIHLFNEDIPFSRIEQITIRLRDDQEKPLQSDNNYLKIETDSKTHKLAVVIDSQEELKEVENAVSQLKKHGVSVYFETYI